MIKTFGIPYMGSKTKIALDILKILPSGNRFVDLFGGGFAMSHAALLIKKYNHVLYNDINPRVTNLVKKAINGDFNYNVFKPTFISRTDFFQNKDSDGYIKYVWSFGSDGKTYAFSKDLEPFRKACHNLVVFDEHSPILDSKCPNIYKVVTSNSIHNRRLQADRFLGNKSRDFPQLSRLERLQNLQNLNHLSHILSISNIDYKDYQFQDGDIVYCDPPYENTNDYGLSFNSKNFYDWCISRPFKVFFSSYKISDNRFNLIFAKQSLSSFASQSNSSINFECLYSN